MKRDEVLKILADQRDTLKAFSVKSLSLFGSVARDEATEASDVDLLVEFDRPVGLFHLGVTGVPLGGQRPRKVFQDTMLGIEALVFASDAISLKIRPLAVDVRAA